MKISMLYMSLSHDSKDMLKNLLASAPIDIELGSLFAPLMISAPADIELPVDLEFTILPDRIYYPFAPTTSESAAVIRFHCDEFVQLQKALCEKYEGVPSFYGPATDYPFIVFCRGNSLSRHQRNWLSTISDSIHNYAPLTLVKPQITYQEI